MIRSHELPTALVGFEHWLEESTRSGEEMFELVAFPRSEEEELAPYLGEARARVEDWDRYLGAAGACRREGAGRRKGVG